MELVAFYASDVSTEVVIVWMWCLLVLFAALFRWSLKLIKARCTSPHIVQKLFSISYSFLSH